MQERVCFHGDGLSLTPVEATALLSRLATTADGLDPDVYSRGGVVTELEDRMARMLGKERAVFMPSGTMANHVAVRTLCAGRGHRVLAQADSHLVNDAGDCATRLSGLNVMALAPDQVCFTSTDVTNILERTAGSKVAVPIGAVSIETPVRRLDNQAVSLPDLVEVTTTVRAAGIGLHLDGARLPLYAAHFGVAPAEIAALFDTVYVSLYKCYSAPSGAILAGPADLIDDLYHTRRMMGGGLAAVWPQAAIALHHVEEFTEESKRVRQMAEELFAQLGADGRCQVTRVANGTNVFRLKLAEGDPGIWRTKMHARGVELPAPEAKKNVFVCKMNPTWLRTTTNELAQALLNEI